MTVPIIQIFQNKKYILIALTAGGLLFLFNYRLMALLPAQGKFSCLIGGALTPFNVGFSLILSLLMGIMVSGLIHLFLKKRDGAFGTMSLMGLGTGVGFFTTFCTACTLPVLSLFGLSLGFGFFTTYNVAFKIMSLTLLLVGLYLLNRQINDECLVCRIPMPSKKAQKR